MLTQSFKEKDIITYAVHTQFRRDFERFLSVGNRWLELDQATYEAVKKYFFIHSTSLHHHHEAEDTYFFPAFEKKSDAIAQSIQELEQQHLELNTKLAPLEKAFVNDERSELEILFKNYCTFVESHLEKEENEVWNPIAELYSKAELDTIAAPISKNTPQKVLSTKMPWFVDAMDDGMKQEFFKTVPFFVPWLYRLSMKRKFDNAKSVFKKFRV